jgi:hypothetical protein
LHCAFLNPCSAVEGFSEKSEKNPDEKVKKLAFSRPF